MGTWPSTYRVTLSLVLLSFLPLACEPLEDRAARVHQASEVLPPIEQFDESTALSEAGAPPTVVDEEPAPPSAATPSPASFLARAAHAREILWVRCDGSAVVATTGFPPVATDYDVTVLQVLSGDLALRSTGSFTAVFRAPGGRLGDGSSVVSTIGHMEVGNYYLVFMGMHRDEVQVVALMAATADGVVMADGTPWSVADLASLVTF